MKQLILIVFFIIFAFVLQADEVDTLVVADSVLTLEQISIERGYVSAIYYIYREDILPWFIDYADSTVLYWYSDNKQTGILYYDMRSKIWVGLPIMDEPERRFIWRRKKINKNILNKEKGE